MDAPDTPSDSPLTLEDVVTSPRYRDLTTAKLEPGDPAFDFELPLLGAADSTIRLSSFAGTQPVALVFGSYT